MKLYLLCLKMVLISAIFLLLVQKLIMYVPVFILLPKMIIYTNFYELIKINKFKAYLVYYFSISFSLHRNIRINIVAYFLN